MAEPVPTDEIVAAELHAERLARRATLSCVLGTAGLALLVISWVAAYVRWTYISSGRWVGVTTDFLVGWMFLLLWLGASILAVGAIKLGLSSIWRANTFNRSLGVAGVVLGLLVFLLMLLPYLAHRMFGYWPLYRVFFPLG